MNTGDLALKHYEMAVVDENRHDLNGAKEHYQTIYQLLLSSDDDSIPVLDWNRIALFFYENNCLDEAFFFAKHSILTGSNSCLPLYIKCCLQIANPVENLNWVLPYILTNPFFTESYQFFQFLSQYSDIYQEVYDVFEMIEEGFLQNGFVNSELYVGYLQLMIDLEIKEGNMPQARYHLRKWLFLDSAYLKQINTMIVYCLYLDDLPYFWKRKDTLSLLEAADKETKLFYEFAKEILKETTVSEELHNRFHSSSFNNPLLAKKKSAYEMLINVIKGKFTTEKPCGYDWTEYKAYILSQGKASFQHFRGEFTHFADIDEAVSLFQVFNRSIFPDNMQSLNDVSIGILGGGEQIGGSCIVVSIGDSHIMIDAGGFVNSKEEQSIDVSPLLERGISLDDLDALIITHAHMDHIGNIPNIFGICNTLPMYATSETKDIMWLMLKEQEKYNAELRKNHLVDKCMVNIRTFDKELSILSKDGQWNIRFFPAGHIRGAVCALIEKDGKTLFVTGDYSIQDQRTVKGLKIPADIHADIVITESTYGFYPTSASVLRSRQEKMFIHQLQNVVKNGGTVLIPAFALGRAQEIISIIRSYLPDLDFPVYIDGMVCQITELYDRYIKKDKNPSKSLLGHGITTAQQNYQFIGFENFLNHVVDKGSCCIIASSGMLNEGTKSSIYAKKLIDNPKNSIIFTGYLDEESPGFIVSQSSHSILLEGEKKEIHASVLSLRLSAHANREEIVQTVLSLQPKYVILVHGDSSRIYKPEKMVNQPYPSVAMLIANANINVIQGQNGMTYQF